MLTPPWSAAALDGEDSVSKFYFNSPVATTQQSPCCQGQTGIAAPHPSFVILSHMWVPAGEGKLFLASSLSAKT